MKTIMVIIDGADREDYKECVYINSLKYKFNINNTPKGMSPNSLVCITNLLGVPNNNIPRGRAYLEALSMGKDIKTKDLILRCNNILIKDGILKGNSNLNEDKLTDINEENIEFYPMESYKNLLVVRNGLKYYNSLITYPPHQHLEEDLKNILPKCKDKDFENLLHKLIYKYNIFPWDQSKKESFKSFFEMHKKSSAVVCKTEVVKGIARALKMHTEDVIGATADIDTNLLSKANKTLKLSKRYDFVLLHINGADEAAHRREVKEKQEFINKIDTEVVKTLITNLDEDTNLIITSDHVTSPVSGKHINEFVKLFSSRKEWRNFYG